MQAATGTPFHPPRLPVDDQAFGAVAELFQYDPALPLDPVSLDTWSDRTPCTFEKVYFRSTHGERVPAFFAYPSDKGFRSAPGILLVHGSNSFWGINEDWVRDWIEVLTGAGYCVLAIDNYGFGERMSSRTSLDEYFGTYRDREIVVQSVTDVRRAIDYLATRPEVTPGKVGLVGGSRGAWLGTLVSGLDKRLSAAVLVVTAHSPGDPRDPMLAFRHALNFAPRITCPILMVSGLRDKAQRVDFARELYRHLACEKREIWLDLPHHIPPRDNSGEILAWLGQTLGQGVRRA
jgi:dienelactone hydrolase